MSTSTSHANIVKPMTGTNWGWPTLSPALQRLILEQLSYHQLRVMHNVCKGLRELTTSTPALRSAFFRTEVVDEAALAALVDLPGRKAAQKARSDHFWSKSTDPPPVPHPSQALPYGPGSFGQRMETCVVLHPLLHSLRVVEKPKTGKNRKMNVRINDKLYWIDAYQVFSENATEPPLSRAQVLIGIGGIGFAHSNATYGQGIGAPAGTSNKPLTVRDIVLGWAACRKSIKSDLGSALQFELFGEPCAHALVHVTESQDVPYTPLFQLAFYHSSWRIF